MMAPVDKTPRHTRYEEGRKEKKAEESMGHAMGGGSGSGRRRRGERHLAPRPRHARKPEIIGLPMSLGVLLVFRTRTKDKRQKAPSKVSKSKVKSKNLQKNETRNTENMAAARSPTTGHAALCLFLIEEISPQRALQLTDLPCRLPT